MTKQTDLIDYLFDGQPHQLSGTLAQWMEASPRFSSFAETYRDKIRKKIRITGEWESILDLRGELEAACRLLDDRRLEVAYEPYASAGKRGPDFAVTYRVNRVFNVEVARIHIGDSEIEMVDRLRNEERLLRTLQEKLGQMQPGMPNLLVIRTPEKMMGFIDLGRFMQEVKIRVEGNDPNFYSSARYTSPAAFYRDFLHLSAILLWATSTELWVNKQARPGLDEKVMRLVALLLSAERQNSLE